MKFELSKITPSLSVGLNLGVFQVSAAVNAEMGRVGEIEFASRVGPSPMSIGSNLHILSELLSLQGLDLESKMNAVALKNVKRKLEGIDFKVGVLTDVGNMRVIGVDFGSLRSAEAIIASLLLCIRHAIGDKSTVRCLKRFLMKLAEKQGTAPIDGAWLEKYLGSFAECVSLAGSFPKLVEAEVFYDEKYKVGCGWNDYGYRVVVEKVVQVLLNILAMPDVDADARTVWWTRSRKVHKLAYLLCYMGWNVQVGPDSDLMPLSETNLVVNFTSVADVPGEIIEDMLNLAGDTSPAHMQSRLEEEQGAGILLPKKGLVHVIRGVLELQENTKGKAVEEAWYLGHRIGEMCKVEVVFGDNECSYRFGDSTFDTLDEYTGGAEDLLYLIDRSLTKYASKLHRILEVHGRIMGGLVEK